MRVAIAEGGLAGLSWAKYLTDREHTPLNRVLQERYDSKITVLDDTPSERIGQPSVDIGDDVTARSGEGGGSLSGSYMLQPYRGSMEGAVLSGKLTAQATASADPPPTTGINCGQNLPIFEPATTNAATV
jgi:hypothetical protein